MQCPFCHAALAPDAKFCRACGKSLTKTCPHCDKPNGLTARFCAGCGYAFSNNAANEASTPGTNTASPLHQTHSNIPHPTPPTSQEPHTHRHAESENAAPSPASPPPIATHPSESKPVSKPDSSPESVGLKTDQSLSLSATGLKRAAPAGDASQRTSQSPRGHWRFMWVGILAVLIVAGAAGGYYVYSKSHALPEIDAVQASQTVKPVPENAPAVPPPELPATEVPPPEPFELVVPPPAIASDKQLNIPQVSASEAPPSVKSAEPAARAPEHPKGVRELLIGHWRMTGGIIEYLPDGSTQGYRGDGSRLNSGWWRLEGDRLTIGWMRNGRRQEVGCTVLSVNEKELRCQNEKGVQRATRLAREDLPQTQVEPQAQPIQPDKTRPGSNVIQQFFNRELENLKKCEGKWGTTPECPASSWGEE